MALAVHTDGNEIIWGAKAIGAVIGLSERKTFHLLETGQLKGAMKIGRRWCISRQNLMANFEPCCDQTTQRAPDVAAKIPTSTSCGS
jgi:hypothetical protein